MGRHSLERASITLTELKVLIDRRNGGVLTWT
jgi:hypothetical protein